MSRQRAAAAFLLAIFGAFAITNSLNNQRLAGSRGSDRLQLIGSELCVGPARGGILGLQTFLGG
jgi:hypothetical protein